MKRVVCLLCSLTLLGGTPTLAQQADTIYHGGPIITIDDRQPTAEAVGVKDGKIIAVGEEADVFGHQGDATKLVKRAIANNVLVIPGNVFSEQDTYFRISYATDNKTIERGCGVLRNLVN